MKRLLLALTFLTPIAAQAQTWSCTNNGVACQPGSSAQCVCAEVQQAPPPPVIVQQAPPQCPFGTYWNGGACIMPAPTYIPPPIYIPPETYNPYWNTPLNQIPGLGGYFPHPGVTQVPGGGFVGPHGFYHPGVR